MTVGVDITKAGDRGVLKRVVQEGEGTEVPSAGCTVTVHYTGYLLDGTKFDSSKDRNEPFEFCLGKKSVIKAWEIGIATMKKGEVCVLTCAPEYAYGAAGSPPKIPPNATLKFEIEMISWQLEDLSPNKSKGILRKIITPGEGFETPNEGSVVTIDIEAKLQDGGETFDTRTVTFTLGEGSIENICDGVERALEKMNRCEKCQLIIQPKYGFKDGNQTLGVPPNAVLVYTITLNTFEKAAENWQMTPSERLEQAEMYKNKANTYFKANKNQLAIKMYTRAISKVSDVIKESDSSDFKSKVNQVMASSYLNLALVYLKAEPAHYFEARENATKALALDSTNVKGYFRRGQAHLELGDAELAIADFEKILEIEPANKAAAQKLIECRNINKKIKEKEKKLYANMFEKFAKYDTEVEKQRASQEVDVIGEKVGEWGTAEGEWTEEQRHRKPTDFEKENPNILMLDKDGQFSNM